jgi:hypothetical protein
MSNLSRSTPEQARPLVLAILVAQSASAILGWTYFFAGPGVIGSAIVLCLAIAVLGEHLAPAPDAMGKRVHG